MTERRLYKIVDRAAWARAEADGVFAGAPVDLQDGYIHLSTAEQVRETARRHFAGAEDLVLVAIPEHALAAHLRWEPSRGGDLFPHFYAPLPTAAVERVTPLPLGPDRPHRFPDGIA